MARKAFTALLFPGFKDDQRPDVEDLKKNGFRNEREGTRKGMTAPVGIRRNNSREKKRNDDHLKTRELRQRVRLKVDMERRSNWPACVEKRERGEWQNHDV